MSFDPQAATAAYIDALGADALAKAAAYTAGNHWLLLWGLVVSAACTWLIVRWGILDRLAARLGRRGPNLRAFLVTVVYFVIATLITLPWEVYADWWRERAYGRTSQPFVDWLAQQAMALVVFALLVGLFFVGVYALLRKAGSRWWAWSGGLTAVALAFFLLAAPAVIEPLFNDYQPVPPGQVRDALVVMAGQSGVPSDRIFVYDGSRQSNNFTANVSGVAGSARIAISDVAFKGASLDEVRAVTGHEIGHYVLHHVWRSVIVLSLLAVLFFFLADRLYPRFARLFGSRARLADPAGLPDALATALVKTAEYRNPRPNAVQEFVFYTHPSVERRVRAAMEWKAAHATTEAGPGEAGHGS